jgi:hypothetical protein
LTHSTRILGSILCALPATVFAGCGAQANRTTEVRVAERGTSGLPAATDADWRRVATSADRTRLRGWRQAWIAALAKVKGSADAGTLSAETLLFDPDRALDHATPPPGAYRCRIFKLGANGTAMRDLTAYPPVECHVADNGGLLSLYKTSGPQRPVGLLFPDSSSRAVFLGTMVLGDETRPLSYGQDGTRDMAGYVERIGEQRWRLVLPYPRFESLLDVVEIVPATQTAANR